MTLKMIRFLILIFLMGNSFSIFSQDTWKIKAANIDPKNYYGVTLANGVVGIVSSPEPLKVKDVVLNGAYDYYQRGRVSKILKTLFDKKVPDEKELLDKQLKEINWKEVDELPSVSDCEKLYHENVENNAFSTF